jgi:hypothetical protein
MAVYRLTRAPSPPDEIPDVSFLQVSRRSCTGRGGEEGEPPQPERGSPWSQTTHSVPGARGRLQWLAGYNLVGIFCGVMLATPADGVRMLVCPSSHLTRTREGSSWSTSSITPTRLGFAALSDSMTILSPT